MCGRDLCNSLSTGSASSRRCRGSVSRGQESPECFFAGRSPHVVRAETQRADGQAVPGAAALHPSWLIGQRFLLLPARPISCRQTNMEQVSVPVSWPTPLKPCRDASSPSAQPQTDPSFLLALLVRAPASPSSKLCSLCPPPPRLMLPCPIPLLSCLCTLCASPCTHPMFIPQLSPGRRG